MRLRPGTDERRYQVKLRRAKRFLDQGYEVRIELYLRGRELARAGALARCRALAMRMREDLRHDRGGDRDVGSDGT